MKSIMGKEPKLELKQIVMGVVISVVVYIATTGINAAAVVFGFISENAGLILQRILEVMSVFVGGIYLLKKVRHSNLINLLAQMLILLLALLLCSLITTKGERMPSVKGVTMIFIGTVLSFASSLIFHNGKAGKYKRRRW